MFLSDDVGGHFAGVDAEEVEDLLVVLLVRGHAHEHDVTSVLPQQINLLVAFCVCLHPHFVWIGEEYPSDKLL